AVRTYEKLAEEIVAEAGRLDAAEDEIFGDKRGDELPEFLTRGRGRRDWLKQAQKELDAERAAAKEPVPKERKERLELCHRRLVENSQTQRLANRAYEAAFERGVRERGRQAMGRGPTPYEQPSKPEGKINTTDPRARRMKFGRNYLPAY